MAYNSSIPEAADDPTDSQGLIKDNFTAISTAFNLNHGHFDDPAEGKHLFLQMPEQTSAPATAANEGGVYTKVASGTTQLFFRDESNGTERQITGAFTGATTGEFTIPGGLIIKWGQQGMAGTSSQTVATGLTSLYHVQISPIGDLVRNFVISIPATPNFNIIASANSTTTVNWLIIGA